MKVFGGSMAGRERQIVAARTQKRAAELLGVTLGYMRDFVSRTADSDEIALATSKPEVVFVETRRDSGKYVERRNI